MTGLLAGWVVMTPVYASAPQSAGFDGVACPEPVPEAVLLFAGGLDDSPDGAFVADGAPLVFYVDPVLWPAFEASLELEDPDLATMTVEWEPPLARVFVDVEQGEAVRVLFTLPDGESWQRVTPLIDTVEPASPVFTESGVSYEPDACDGAVYGFDLSPQWVLARPDALDAVPRLFHRPTSYETLRLPVGSAAREVADCEAANASRADVRVWALDTWGRRSDPVVYAFPTSDTADTADPGVQDTDAGSGPPPSTVAGGCGCTSGSLAAGWVWSVVPLLFLRRRGAG